MATHDSCKYFVHLDFGLIDRHRSESWVALYRCKSHFPIAKEMCSKAPSRLLMHGCLESFLRGVTQLRWNLRNILIEIHAFPGNLMGIQFPPPPFKRARKTWLFSFLPVFSLVSCNWVPLRAEVCSTPGAHESAGFSSNRSAGGLGSSAFSALTWMSYKLIKKIYFSSKYSTFSH